MDLSGDCDFLQKEMRRDGEENAEIVCVVPNC